MSASRPFLGRHARIGLVAAVAAGACLAPVSAAVIPLGFDKQEVGGPGARLPDASPLNEMSGQWVGKDASGRDVKLELHVAGDAIAGSATLAGAMPDSAAAQLPVAQVALAGRTLVFAVRPRACDNRDSPTALQGRGHGDQLAADYVQALQGRLIPSAIMRASSAWRSTSTNCFPLPSISTPTGSPLKFSVATAWTS